MQSEMVFGEAKNFKRIVGLTDLYAKSEWPILILGETGVGKELVARRIHQKSSRSRAPFIPLNCGAIPAGLFESELFGFERGAFSGAVQSSRGLLRQAQGGTLFLDEVGELELSLQVKLLRMLDSGEIRSVGGARTEAINARVVAATNIDLQTAVAEGSFRRDLAERLCVLTLSVPPLRDRKEDILPIAKFWLESLGARFESETLEILKTYDWPGNIRQLRNVLVRASVRNSSLVDPALLAELLTEEASSTGLSRRDLLQGSLADIEKQVIVQKLKQCHGNRKRTAEELGIAKSTLHEKLRRWKQDPEERMLWPLARTMPRPSLSV